MYYKTYKGVKIGEARFSAPLPGTFAGLTLSFACLFGDITRSSGTDDTE